MILLVGVAGSGKSMQGNTLADAYGYAYLSSGDIFRVLITGKRRQEMLDGRLLSDAEVINVFDKILDLIDTKAEFILDGFPRTKEQVDWIIAQQQKGRFSVPVVINLEIEESVVRERLSKRNRSDDTDEAIARRFAEYKAQTYPILAYMREKGIVVHDIDADQSPEQVHEQIVARIITEA
jgi:adenylate kinase